jgi:hypothetical protein
MKCLVLAPVFVLFAGCAAQPEQQVSDAAQRPCELTFRVGSNVPTRDCSVQAQTQSEGEKQRTMELLREPIKPRTTPSVAGG